MATALSPEVQLMRRRLRHIHIPDLPPVYAPRSLAPTIRDHIQGQITRQRAVQDDPPLDQANHGFGKITSRVPTSFTSWVKRAGPPPTVLSFTRRPTYILPKHQVEAQEPWQVEYLVKSLKSRVDLQFPEPPRWSSRPWRPFWERDQIESEWRLDPLNHHWPGVGVLIMPCAEAMFLGPGQLSLWPIIDLKDRVQLGRAKLKTKYEFERILEDTTIEILKREFGIQAFAIPGATGVWVESRIPPPEVDVDRIEGDAVKSPPDRLDDSNRRANVRRIATVHASITNDITQWGVSLHVGQPNTTSDSWTHSTNPWTPIRQHNTTTSIAAELAYMKSSASPLGPSKYLFTHFNQKAVPARAGQGAIPYSLIKSDLGRRHPAPLGMDNRDISTAWTYEFARQLEMKDGHVDHYSMVEANDTNTRTNLPTNTSGPGFRFKGVFSEDVMNSSYRQVDVPHIMVGKHEKVSPGIVEESMRIEHHDGRIDAASHDGWLLSWPLWQRTLLGKLDEAICGGPSDTRVRVYEMQKQMSSKLQRRRNDLVQAKKVEEEWRADMPHLVRRPMTDSVIRELADRSREMEGILKTVRMGNKSVKLLDSTIQIRRLLERRFAGAFSRNADAPEPGQSDPFSELVASSEAASAAGGNTSSGRDASWRPLRPAQPPLRPAQPPLRPAQPPLMPTQPPLRPAQPPLMPTQPANPAPPSKTRPAESAQDQVGDVQLSLDAPGGQGGVMSIRRPRVFVEFTKTHGDNYQGAAEKREQAREKRRERREAARKWRQVNLTSKDASEGEDPPGASVASRTSRFLPNTHQIGGSQS